jgi:predicted DNA-binding protein
VNQEILLRLQEDGIAVPSGTPVRGRYAIRAAITNHRSRLEDFDLLADAVERIGREVVGKQPDVTQSRRGNEEDADNVGRFSASSWFSPATLRGTDR